MGLLQQSNVKVILGLLILGSQLAQNILLLQSPSDFCNLPKSQIVLAVRFKVAL
jgi:hypothetical protein